MPRGGAKLLLDRVVSLCEPQERELRMANCDGGAKAEWKTWPLDLGLCQPSGARSEIRNKLKQ